MANGVIVDQATYYGDTQTYTGESGSKTNMYVIEDFYDLNSMPTNTRAVHYVLVKDIEMNDYDDYKHGVSKVVNNRYGIIHGGGNKIRNLIIKDSSTSVFYLQELNDVVFENLIFLNCDEDCKLLACSSTMVCSNLRIGAYLFNSYTSSIFSVANGVEFNFCSFNIRGVSEDGLTTWHTTKGHTFSDCHIHVDIETPSTNGIIGATDRTEYKRSYITGKIRHTSESDVILNAIYGITLNNSYIAVEFTNAAANFVGYTAEAVVSDAVSFIDSELISNFTEVPVDNLYYLTTEQCKDPSYLLSIGFPVIPI